MKDQTEKIVEQSEPKDYYFGYFCQRIDGRERILVRKTTINNSYDWDFLFAGFRENNKSIQASIDLAIRKFANQNHDTKQAFLESGFSEPEVIQLELQDSDPITIVQNGEHFRIRPFFVKVELNLQLDLEPEKFLWLDKREIFKETNIKFHQSQFNRDTLVRAIRSDSIQTQFGYRLLNCVDIIVFREHSKNPGKYEFLMLYRKNPKEKFRGWEYPKGGLEYHETLQEGALRELLEETGIGNVGVVQFGGYLGYQTPDVTWRRRNNYDALRVYGLTYLFYGDDNDIKLFREEGHREYKWMSWEEAKNNIWIGKYGEIFFDRWKEKSWEIIRRISRPISLAFQITEECPLGCKFCLRRQDGEKDLTLKERKKIIDILHHRGIVRLTVTGGEPMLPNKKPEVLSIIEYAHTKKIHTCLSTTGHNISEADIRRLENSLDQLLLSMHSRDETLARRLYEQSKTWKYLSKNVEKILEWTKNSKIVVEISTVISQVNIHHIVELGQWLFGQNPDIFWKLEEYYPNGKQDDERRNIFELSPGKFTQLKMDIEKEFSTQMLEKRIRISSKESRKEAPDLMITPQGNLVTSSNSTYSWKGNISDLLFLELQNRRDWKEYRDCIRIDWDW